jgi:hypothetical protein
VNPSCAGTTIRATTLMPSTIRSGGVPGDARHHPNLQGMGIVRVGGKFRLKERIGSGSFGLSSTVIFVFDSHDPFQELSTVEPTLFRRRRLPLNLSLLT